MTAKPSCGTGSYLQKMLWTVVQVKNHSSIKVRFLYLCFKRQLCPFPGFRKSVLSYEMRAEKEMLQPVLTQGFSDQSGYLLTLERAHVLILPLPEVTSTDIILDIILTIMSFEV